jgi:hypothetical protein
MIVFMGFLIGALGGLVSLVVLTTIKYFLL